MRKKLKLFGLCVISVFTLCLSACQDKGKPYQAVGVVEVRPFYVTSPDGGELKRLYVKEGDGVKKNQSIAKVAGQSTLKAPSSGRVMETFYLQKEYVYPGTVIATILLPEQVHLVFYVPETDLNRIQIDKVVTVRYRDHDYPAKIGFIATEAEYTPDSLYQDGNRHKSVFKVKADMPKQLKDLVKVGQSVDVFYE